MKNIFLTLFVLNAFITKSQNWEWVKLMQPTNNKSYMGVKVGLDGNVYGGGYFNSSIDLGNGYVINGGTDGFITQFDTAGLCQWKQKINVTTQGCGCNVQGNTTNAQIAGFDSQGNIIVFGSFCGCGETFGNGITSSATGFNLYLAKYNSAGQCLWVKTKAGAYNSGTGTTVDIINAITIDTNDNIYISMLNYAASTSFCGLNFSSNGQYLFKVNTNGVGIWSIQTANTTSGYSIMQMKHFNNRLYASSQFGGTCTF